MLTEAKPAGDTADLVRPLSSTILPLVTETSPADQLRPVLAAETVDAVTATASEGETPAEPSSVAAPLPAPVDEPVDRPHRPPAIELFDVLSEDDGPPSPFEAAIEAEEAEARRRNRRGIQFLFGLLLVIVAAYELGLDGAVQRLLVGHSLPGTSIETVAQSATAPAGATLAEEIARLARAPEPNVTTARLVIDGGGAAVDVAGRIEWTRSGRSERPDLRGRITFPGRATAVELLFEEESSPVDGFDRMMLVAFVDLPAPFTDIAMFDRIDPKGPVERTAEGTVVRIGLDRALYGYRGVPGDRAAAFEDRSLFRMRFTLESGLRGYVLFRLPDQT